MADLQRKTANLLDYSFFASTQYVTVTPITNGINLTGTYYAEINITLEVGTTYYMTWDENVISGSAYVYWRLQYTDNTYSASTRSGVKLTPTKEIAKVLFYVNTTNTQASVDITNLMLNTGTASLPYEPYGWVHSLRKMSTATEAVENPLYSDGTAITAYTIKGNTVQNGTPTPSNPVDVNGVGNKTANLLPITSNNVIVYGASYNNFTINADYSIYCSGVSFMAFIIAVDSSTTYTVQATSDVRNLGLRVREYSAKPTDYSTNFVVESVNKYFNVAGTETASFTTSATTTYIAVWFYAQASVVPCTISDIMVNIGSTALSYEPHGYKIPISTAQGSAVNYLGSVQSNRQIQKLVLDGNEESWSRSTSYSGGFFSSWSNFGGINYGAIYCSHAQYVSDITDYVSGTCYSDGSLNIRIMPEGSTVTQWREYLAQQYANGTPVTVWYILQTATTGIVNEPLMKIGDYADSISNAVSIPTIEGANSITVDTTVQPSEFTAMWTGWHDASVQEYVGGANLSPITAFTNTTVDTRDFIRLMYYTSLNGVRQQEQQLADISTNGSKSYTLNVTKDNDTLVLRHSGSQANINIFIINGGVPQGTYTLSFDVEGHDCSTVGGLVLSNIEFKDSNGGHWE